MKGQIPELWSMVMGDLFILVIFSHGLHNLIYIMYKSRPVTDQSQRKNRGKHNNNLKHIVNNVAIDQLPISSSFLAKRIKSFFFSPLPFQGNSGHRLGVGFVF